MSVTIIYSLAFAMNRRVVTAEIAHDIAVIDTHFHRDQFCASHLIRENDKGAFIDVGSAMSVPYLLRALDELNLQTSGVTHIILTHIHLDHAGGAGILMRLCPNAHLWGFAAFDPDALEGSINRLQSMNPSFYFIAHFGPIAAHPESVQSLISLIRQHMEIGRNMAEDADHAAIVPQLRDLCYQAYCRQPGARMGLEQFNDVLEFDLDLNAQGLAVWASRQRTLGA